MRNFIQYIATFLPIACMALFSHGTMAQGFEGVIELNTNNPTMQEEASVSWVTAGGNHRLTFNGVANGQKFSYSLLILKNDGSMRILTEVDGVKAMFVAPASNVTFANPPLGKAIVTVGDGTTTLAGYNCKKYTVESAEGSATVFVTDQVSLNLKDLPVLLQKNGIFATLAANNITGLPLSIISRGADGKVVFSQTITAIKPGTVSASEFSYEGYTEGGAALQNSLKVK